MSQQVLLPTPFWHLQHKPQCHSGHMPSLYSHPVLLLPSFKDHSWQSSVSCNWVAVCVYVLFMVSYPSSQGYRWISEFLNPLYSPDLSHRLQCTNELFIRVIKYLNLMLVKPSSIYSLISSCTSFPFVLSCIWALLFHPNLLRDKFQNLFKYCCFIIYIIILIVLEYLL